MRKSRVAARQPERSNVRVAYDAIQADIRRADLSLARLSGRGDTLREMRDRLAAIVRAVDAATGEREGE